MHDWYNVKQRSNACLVTDVHDEDVNKIKMKEDLRFIWLDVKERKIRSLR